MLRMGLSSAVSEELAQETLFIVWRKARLFDATRGTASSWISAIAQNLRIDLARRERRPARHAGFDVDAEVCPHDQPHPELHVSLVQAQRYVLTALATLSESQARLIELSFYREMAHADIARALRIPLGTVKSRLRSALVHLRWSLDGLA
jgi:RNA polymerase sigma-70 factor, ECF subfamily